MRNRRSGGITTKDDEEDYDDEGESEESESDFEEDGDKEEEPRPKTKKVFHPDLSVQTLCGLVQRLLAIRPSQ